MSDILEKLNYELPEDKSPYLLEDEEDHEPVDITKKFSYLRNQYICYAETTEDGNLRIVSTVADEAPGIGDS